MACTVSRSVTIDRPVEAVARYLSDFTNSQSWIAHNESCMRVDDGPVRVGARYRTVARVGPLVETIDQVVVEFDPGRRLVVEGRSTYLRTRDELTFAAAGDGATVSYTVRIDLVGRATFGNRLLAPFVNSVADHGATHLTRTLLEVLPAGAAVRAHDSRLS